MDRFKIGIKVKVIKKSTRCGSCGVCERFIGKIGIIKDYMEGAKNVHVHLFPGTEQWCSGFSKDCLELVNTDWDE